MRPQPIHLESARWLGAPPEMKVEGAGLDARVTVGERRIRFEENRIVIE